MALNPVHEKRLRNLLASWAVRLSPNAKGQQPEILKENIEALEGVLSAIAQRNDIAPVVQNLKQVRRELRRRSRVGLPITRADLMAFTNRIENAISKLEAL